MRWWLSCLAVLLIPAPAMGAPPVPPPGPPPAGVIYYRQGGVVQAAPANRKQLQQVLGRDPWQGIDPHKGFKINADGLPEPLDGQPAAAIPPATHPRPAVVKPRRQARTEPQAPQRAAKPFSAQRTSKGIVLSNP